MWSTHHLNLNRMLTRFLLEIKILRDNAKQILPYKRQLLPFSPTTTQTKIYFTTKLWRVRVGGSLAKILARKISINWKEFGSFTLFCMENSTSIHFLQGKKHHNVPEIKVKLPTHTHARTCARRKVYSPHPNTPI